MNDKKISHTTVKMQIFGLSFTQGFNHLLVKIVDLISLRNRGLYSYVTMLQEHWIKVKVIASFVRQAWLNCLLNTFWKRQSLLKTPIKMLSSFEKLWACEVNNFYRQNVYSVITWINNFTVDLWRLVSIYVYMFIS